MVLKMDRLIEYTFTKFNGSNSLSWMNNQGGVFKYLLTKVVQQFRFVWLLLHAVKLTCPPDSVSQVRERVQPMPVCLRSCPGCAAWGSCAVCCAAIGSPRRSTGTCRFRAASLVVSVASTFWLNLGGGLSGFSWSWTVLKVVHIFSCMECPTGTTASTWGPRVTCSRISASSWSTFTSWRQTRLARSSWRKSRTKLHFCSVSELEKVLKFKLNFQIKCVKTNPWLIITSQQWKASSFPLYLKN